MRARDELLAGAVLAVDEDAPLARRRHRHLLAQLLHDVVVAHHGQPPVRVRAQRAIALLPADAPAARC